MLTVVPDPSSGDESRRADALAGTSLIDEIVREGARRMLAEALRAEVDAYIAAFADERDECGHRLVVRNGYHQPREVLTSAGAVEVTAPRVNDKRVDAVTGERERWADDHPGLIAHARACGRRKDFVGIIRPRCATAPPTAPTCRSTPRPHATRSRPEPGSDLPGRSGACMARPPHGDGGTLVSNGKRVFVVA
jgi:hypothetical protein